MLTQSLSLPYEQLTTAPTNSGTGDVIRCAREAQARWAARPLRHRLAVIRRLRHAVGEHGLDLARGIAGVNRTVATSLVAEVLPLADAMRFLERYAGRVLRSVRWGRRGRPFWLAGTRLEVLREPLGVVLIVAPGNYPLLLPGVQAMQALVAGNAVLVKPSPGHEEPVRRLRDLAVGAGLEPGLFEVVTGGPEQVQAAVETGVDKVVLTGSADTGRAVLADLAPRLVPAVTELSGCDAVFVRDDADLDLAARGLAFGLGLNGGATCIAPRRVFVPARLLPALESLLEPLVARLPDVQVPIESARRLRDLVAEAVGGGGRVLSPAPSPTHAAAAPPWPGCDLRRPVVLTGVRPGAGLLREDVFAPVLSLIGVSGDEEALAQHAACPYALGATVFGRPARARALAARINAGTVVVNDVIVPTADPRLPFGGRGQSGFGVTRGLEGLLEMTRLKAVSVRSGRFRPHFDPPRPADEAMFAHYLLAAHGGSLWRRVGAAAGLVRGLLSRSRAAEGTPKGEPHPPSPGTPGEDRGEGEFLSSEISDAKSQRPMRPHPNLPPEYRERGQDRCGPRSNVVDATGTRS